MMAFMLNYILNKAMLSVDEEKFQILPRNSYYFKSD